MKEEQKVYIRGNAKRGKEVIKILTDLGGDNSYLMDGDNVNAYYFINPNGIIVNTYSSGSEVFSYVKEFYKEIKLPMWKPKYRDYYYYIASNGIVKQEMSNNTALDDSYYEFGNCFKTFEEAEAARDSIKEMLNNRA